MPLRQKVRVPSQNWSQQGWPVPPHVQVPLTQTKPAWQVLPAQQGWCPSPLPQEQMPLKHTVPAWQVLFGGQQGWPTPPQEQVPLTQAVPA
jgi:hypothetical protein